MPNEIALPVMGIVQPTVMDTSGVTEIENSELRKIAEDTLNAVKFAFVSVAANPTQEVRPNSLEAAFKEGLKEMEKRPDASALTRIQDKAKQLVQLPPAAKLELFGRYGRMDSQSFLANGFDRAHEALEAEAPLKIDTKLLGLRTPTIALAPGVLESRADGLLIPAANLPTGFEDFEEDWEEAAEKAAQSDVFNADKLADIWGPVYTGDPFAPAFEEAEEFEGQAVTDKLMFYIRRVKCVDETNPEWWGSDEIALAGVSVDETGDTKKIGERFVGGGFDDGDSKSLNWNYHWFGLREGNKWPKRYTMALILAEKDWGGLSKALNTVWERIKDYVKSQIERWVTAGLTSYLGPLLASWLGKIVAWIVDKLIGWIINAFADDIFPPFTASIVVPGLNYRWPGGSAASPYREAHFYGHGGHYLVEYNWRMYA